MFFVISFIIWNNIKILNGNFRVEHVFKNGFAINVANKKFFAYYKINNNVDFVYLNSVIEKINKTNKDFLFLKNMQIDFILKIIDIKENENTSIFNFFKVIIQKNTDISQEFLNYFLFAKKLNVENIYQKIKNLNIVHLFVVSGYHFFIIYFIFKKVFSKVKLLNKIDDFIIILILSFYIYLLNFNLPSVRVYTYFLFKLILIKILKCKFSNLQIFVISALLNFSFKPNSISSLSFILSFGLSYIGLKMQMLNTKYKTLKFSLICYLFSICVMSQINNKFNVFGFIFQYIFNFIVIFYYIYSLLFFWFFYLNNIVYDFLFQLIEKANQISIYFDFLKLNLAYALIFWISINFWLTYKKIKQNN
ncbi:MAG0480 family ComEC-like protein [Mycoplasma zalophi]|uniref:MAG0480 family ComEC-like protein n=1 Tax=Mycoplasma zalophi TaxID=191287 RepID=UPI001C10D2FD|nr:ComEC/Rec2 family competence protein [Mycoplasma zalophi]MBU4690816.1 ComEC/Rec2 family competence protein [Mycoplasma zalophi]